MQPLGYFEDIVNLYEKLNLLEQIINRWGDGVSNLTPKISSNFELHHTALNY